MKIDELHFIYGTAWKEGETARLTRLALQQGFRAIDSANQRKHYFEAGVGEAVAGALADGLVSRDQIWLQSKFTHPGGQDHRLPYAADADPATQVRQSMDSSLLHLQVDYLDSYVLHGPSLRIGWTSRDHEVWCAMEELQRTGKCRYLGVSNVSLEQLEDLCAWAVSPPRFVQNRCYAVRGWDRAVRGLCSTKGLIYQGFSLLTANSRELTGPVIRRIAASHGGSAAQVVFRFSQQIGILPLTGTTDAGHMREDLDSVKFDLSEDDLRSIEFVSA